MGANFNNKDIRAWLEKPENRKQLSEEAKSIFHKIKLGIIPPVFIDRNSIVNEPSRDIIAMIESELAIFLYEKGEIFGKLFLSDDKNFSRYLITAFKNHCIDIARKKDIDPRKYLYKRFSDVLRQSEKFHTRADKKEFMSFSCRKDNRRVVPLTLEDVSDINFPADVVEDMEYKSINRKKVILELSEYFWMQVTQKLGDEPVWLKVWSVIEWIGLHIQWDVPEEMNGIELHRLQGSPAGNDEKTSQVDAADRVPDYNPKPDEIYFDPNTVINWAGCFAERLNQKEKAIFYFRQELKLNFEEIAKKIDQKGPSGPYYLLKQTEVKLKVFLRDLDWLNPDELNEEAFSLFYDTLISILKKSVSES
jgi:hypothetical protein